MSNAGIVYHSILFEYNNHHSTSRVILVLYIHIIIYMIFIFKHFRVRAVSNIHQISKNLYLLLNKTILHLFITNFSVCNGHKYN